MVAEHFLDGIARLCRFGSVKADSSTSIFSAAALRFSEAPTATVVGCFLQGLDHQ
jgi:hypothetical protein